MDNQSFTAQEIQAHRAMSLARARATQRHDRMAQWGVALVWGLFALGAAVSAILQ